MIYSPLLIFSSLTIITAGLASLVIYLISFREKNALHKSSLRQWALAFFLMTWVRMPTILAASGVEIMAYKLIPFYLFAFVAFIIAYLLFYRGAIQLFTEKKFWINTFPILVFIFFAASTFALHFIAEIQTTSLITVSKVFSYSIILFFIAATITFLARKSASLVPIGKAGIIIMNIGWILFLISDFSLLRSMLIYPRDFWFIALISEPATYLGLTIAHLLILLGIVLNIYHKEPKA